MNSKRLLGGLVGAALLLAGCAQSGSGTGNLSLTDAPKFGNFVWHDLITDDPDTVRPFYSAVFGWSYEDTRTPAGRPYTLIRSGSGNYVGGIVELADPEGDEDYSRWLGYFAVPNVDEAARATVDAGGEVVAPSRDIGDVARVSAVKDPQGAVVGFITSRVGYPVDRTVVDAGEISWNELITEDPGAAAQFYAQLGGSDVRQPESGGSGATLWSEGRERAGISKRPADQLQPLWITFFAVENVQTTVRRVKSAGGRLLLEPDAAVRNGSIAIFVDPAGAVLGLRENHKEQP